jgi:VIT1/CCC1 family predicted Fe2+/Mn2+ transporter
MAVSNYLSTKSDRERVDRARHLEGQHIERIPEGERQEVREIFRQKGFKGDLLDRVVDVITEDREVWIETMLRDELKLHVNGRSPWKAGLATFLAFLAVGLIPLLPFLVSGLSDSVRIPASAALTGLAFVGVGLAKGHVLQRSRIRSGVETLLLGGGAAALAYLFGHWLRLAYGAG